MIVITLLPQGLNQAHVDPSQRGVPQVQCENNSSWTKSRFPEVMIRGERIIRYSNIIRIIFEYQNIRIRIGRYFQAE